MEMPHFTLMLLLLHFYSIICTRARRARICTLSPSTYVFIIFTLTRRVSSVLGVSRVTWSGESARETAPWHQGSSRVAASDRR